LLNVSTDIINTLLSDYELELELIMKSKRTGFTLIELMVVILIVGVLAAVTIPTMRGKIDKSKWSEANAGAGCIRTAVKVYFAETGNKPIGNLGNPAIQEALEIQVSDLTGTFFVPADYAIDSVNDDGMAVVTVTGSKSNAPTGSRTLDLDGSWE
jgi:prepilin-type N-terminal cleavage/methylation domain-containing protein